MGDKLSVHYNAMIARVTTVLAVVHPMGTSVLKKSCSAQLARIADFRGWQRLTTVPWGKMFFLPRVFVTLSTPGLERGSRSRKH